MAARVRVTGPRGTDRLAACAAAYRARLADRKVLVVLDDAADPAQVRPLLPGTPGSAVVVTSRGRLTGLTATATRTLGPLRGTESRALLATTLGPCRDRGRTRRGGPHRGRLRAPAAGFADRGRARGSRAAPAGRRTSNRTVRSRSARGARRAGAPRAGPAEPARASGRRGLGNRGAVRRARPRHRDRAPGRGPPAGAVGRDAEGQSASGCPSRTGVPA